MAASLSHRGRNAFQPCFKFFIVDGISALPNPRDLRPQFFGANDRIGGSPLERLRKQVFGQFPIGAASQPRFPSEVQYAGTARPMVDGASA